jgi:hypothetical protein
MEDRRPLAARQYPALSDAKECAAQMGVSEAM